ncbi:MAG: LLM class flavin-dependent oxidoreductase, partial [Dehalococcoidia bacterium]
SGSRAVAARICLQLPWNPDGIGEFVSLARCADEAGVDSLWVNEGFGHDAFSGLAILARETSRVRLGTSIVNVYSRTPGALAQHFATIDQLSGGRVIVGLGASAPGVVERFHGVRYTPPLARLRETAELLRAYWRKERFDHDGPVFHVERSLELGASPVQATPPVFLATMAPASVELTGKIGDGWLPAWIPRSRLGSEIKTVRDAAERARRPRDAVTVRSPSAVTVAANEETAERVRQQQAATLAFFVARNGEFYFNQFCRQGLEDEAHRIRDAWASGGPQAAAAAVPFEMAAEFGFVGHVDACRERIADESLAGVDLHTVSLAGFADEQRREVLAAL